MGFFKSSRFRIVFRCEHPDGDYTYSDEYYCSLGTLKSTIADAAECCKSKQGYSYDENARLELRTAEGPIIGSIPLRAADYEYSSDLEQICEKVRLHFGLDE